MANGDQTTPMTTTAVNFPKTPTGHGTPQNDSTQSKRDLTSWWKNFKRGNKLEDSKGPQGIFGVPLHTSIRYANVAISLFNENGESYIYGYVPIVVAKCGVFLKEKATDTEGIFRLAGSEKRIKELKVAFDSPDRYGKGLDWTGYTVHDAANILRRYFNQLPEPIIPLDFYERFREPLRHHQFQAVGQMEQQKPDMGDFSAEAAIRAYQGLITELPPLNRQLLLYILDLLAVFASKSDLNKMTTPNLAAIFQPGILSHPQHDMSPQEYRLSQDVLIFLIENQDSFLIGMQGTAADEKTVQELQSGYQAVGSAGSPVGVHGRSKTVIGRSSSNASGGTEGGRKFSTIRRNLSTSSRNSRKSSLQPGGSPRMGSPSLGSSGGVYRSNTVPSQRPAASSPRYASRDKGSDPPTPIAILPESPLPPPVQPVPTVDESEQTTPTTTSKPAAWLSPIAPAPPEITSASSSEATTPLAAPGSSTSSAVLIPKERQDRELRGGLLSPEAIRRDGSSERNAPPRHFLGIFRQSPGGDQEKKDQRQPRKLQKKKRLPGSALSSAHSSANDLGNDTDDAADSVASPTTPNHRETDPMADARPGMTTLDTADPNTRDAEGKAQDLQPPTQGTADTLRPHSPQQSVQSAASVTDPSDGELMDESATIAERQERKSRWRFSHSAKSRQQHSDNQVPSSDSTPRTPQFSPPPPPPPPPTGSVTAGLNSPVTTDPSRANSSPLAAMAHHYDATAGEEKVMGTPRDNGEVFSDSEDRKKGPMSWIRGKIQERKEKEAEKRAKSPTGFISSNHSERDTSAEKRKSTQLSRHDGVHNNLKNNNHNNHNNHNNDRMGRLSAETPRQASHGSHGRVEDANVADTADPGAVGGERTSGTGGVGGEAKKAGSL